MIPLEFQHCALLECFNVSFNHLLGHVPSNWLFRSMNNNVLVGNPGLYAGVLAESSFMKLNDPYLTSSSYYMPDTKKKFHNIWDIIWLPSLVVFILIVGKTCYYNQFIGHAGGRKYREENLKEEKWKMTAFQELSFTI